MRVSPASLHPAGALWWAVCRTVAACMRRGALVRWSSGRDVEDEVSTHADGTCAVVARRGPTLATRHAGVALAAALMLPAGCGNLITGDDAVVDAFATWQAQGGTCKPAIEPGQGPISTATQLSYWMPQAVLPVLVGEFGGVDYTRASTDPELLDVLDQIVTQLARVDVQKLSSHNEKLAFWINAYNLIVLRAATLEFMGDPAFRVDQNAFAFFDRAEHSVGGMLLSLNGIENGVLRGDRTHPSMSGLPDAEWAPIEAAHEALWQNVDFDPRFHFVLNCASRSCPPLPFVPLRGQDMPELLDGHTSQFLHDEARGAGPEGISSIFDFYWDDFVDVGGVEAFIAQYRELDDVDTGVFLPYDWALNNEPFTNVTP